MSTGTSFIIPPKRRRKWRKRLVVLGFTVAVPIAHWWWGYSVHRRLDRQFQTLAAQGDPITLAELNPRPEPSTQPSPDATRVLRPIARAIDIDSEAWGKFDLLQLR